MKASVVVVAHHSGTALLRCLASLTPERQGELEVVVVDNGDDPEIEEASRLSYVRVISPGTNLGYAAGSNLGASAARGDVLVFLNPDTVAAPGSIPAIGGVLDDNSIGIAMARLRLLDRPELLNSRGNVLHVSGLAWVGGHGEPVETVTDVRDVACPSGAAMAIRAELFRDLGGFTEKLFMYHEDIGLGWRARLNGRRVVVSPQADVYHEYDFGRNPRKSYYLERNRLVFVLSAYSGRLLLVLAPVLVSAELAMVVLAAKEGWLREKLAGWAWCAQHRRWLLGHRRETQRLRRVPDRVLARLLTAVIDPAVVEVPAAVRLANPLLAAYWSLARRGL
jgi:GT2 family glycosyltransferase